MRPRCSFHIQSQALLETLHLTYLFLNSFYHLSSTFFLILQFYGAEIWHHVQTEFNIIANNDYATVLILKSVS